MRAVNYNLFPLNAWQMYTWMSWWYFHLGLLLLAFEKICCCSCFFFVAFLILQISRSELESFATLAVDNIRSVKRTRWRHKAFNVYMWVVFLIFMPWCTPRFCGLLQFPGVTRTKSFQQLTIFLCHKYPQVSLLVDWSRYACLALVARGGPSERLRTKRRTRELCNDRTKTRVSTAIHWP